MKSATLKPGLLVALKTSVRGGVNYRRTEIDPDHLTEDGERCARWETTRTIEDAVEYERAVQVRGRCSNLVRMMCARSDFGLLCPEDRIPALEAAIAEARALADEHNRTAARTQVTVFTLTGRIAPNDIEAIRAISSELRDLMAEMEQGIKAADPRAIRDAAARAKNIGGMLSNGAAERVQAAIEQARAAAKEIAKRVQKGAEVAEQVVAEIKVDAIETARMSFLDFDAPAPVEAIPAIVAGVDFAPEVPVAPTHVAASVPAVEF